MHRLSHAKDTNRVLQGSRPMQDLRCPECGKEITEWVSESGIRHSTLVRVVEPDGRSWDQCPRCLSALPSTFVRRLLSGPSDS